MSRAKSEQKHYERGLTDAARIVSLESALSRASGEPSAMYALNRAWRKIFILLDSARAASAPTRPAPTPRRRK